MTEQQQGGTAPEPGAIASSADQAPDEAVGAVAVADEPAATEQTAADDTGTAADDTTDRANGSAIAQTAPSSNGTGIATRDGVESGGATAIVDVDTADAPAASDDEADAPPRELGPEPTTMEELLAEQDSDIKSFKHGDVVEGKVVRIDKDEILVDIGAKSEGVVSNRELYGRNAESQPQLAIGDTVLVYVLQPESQEGHVVLSLRRAGLERKWRSMQEQFEAGVIIEAPVIDHNKGGLIVDCGIRGFVPISQIVDFPRRPQNDQPRDAAQEIAEKLMPFVGRKLRLKILEVNRKANRLILSEKVALYEERREKRDELFSSLQVGQKVTGTVRSIAPFGVFIDLGGIDGLVHKSELSWNKVNNPEAGYKVGDEVEAEVIDI
ncbi:MAG TPA: S1 RNA-binding domain-containing protein, partial [Candidatus Limnocylindrales bacterium]|nr:S1 RNA-binding domain-containing protein [Candidatus Limnocylindrales bacterium]